MKILLMALGSLVVSSQSLAAWTLVSNSQGFRQFVEFESLKRNGSYVEVLEMLDFDSPQRFGQKSMLLTMEYDCSKMLFRAVSGKIFRENMGKGERINAPSQTSDWVKPNSGSISGNTLKTVCTVK